MVEQSPSSLALLWCAYVLSEALGCQYCSMVLAPGTDNDSGERQLYYEN